MFEKPGLYLNTRVYAIRKRNDLDEILAYRIHQEKGFISYTFQTRRTVPEVLEIYRKLDNDEYYPVAFILPPPSPEMHGQSIPFDGYFALVIGYAKEIPPHVPLNNLIYAHDIKIIGEENKLSEIHIEGISGLDFLKDHKESRKYVLYLENVTNSADLISFIIYNRIYSTSSGKNGMRKAGWFIVIDDDTSKNHTFTPTDVKILEIFM
ncbi:MAG: hypothetical protein RQ869_01120 [Candidatus Nanopusillus sp.]|nr:hypothetical protein [Candidatus Nanopusillus sp.]